MKVCLQYTFLAMTTMLVHTAIASEAVRQFEVEKSPLFLSSRSVQPNVYLIDNCGEIVISKRTLGVACF